MIPRAVQRWLVVAAAPLAGWLYLPLVQVARREDGAEGLVLLFAPSPVAAICMLLALSLPAALLGLLFGALGNPLGGVFVLAVGLMFPAASSGTIEHWLRDAGSADAYRLLALEAGLWMLLWLLILLVCYQAGPRIGHRLGLHGPREGRMPAAASGPPKVEAGAEEPAGWVGVGVSLVAGVVLAGLLIRSADTAQVVCGLGVAFLIAAVGALHFFPSASSAGILVSPVLAAMGWYLWIGLGRDLPEPLLQAYFAGELLGGGLALPVHYASAGVAGAAVGISWAHAMARAGSGEAERTDRLVPARHARG